MAGDIVAFLRARLDEDETNSRYALAQWPDTHFTIDPGSLIIVEFHRRHDPARVLREVAAKRAILELHRIEATKIAQTLYDPYTGERLPDAYDVQCAVCGWACDDPASACETLRHLAAVYSGHPDYDPAWAPNAKVAPRLPGRAGESIMSDVINLLTQACNGTPDWDHVSRQHWVMNLDWYKQIRRHTALLNPNAEQDENKWAPDPGDQIFGYPVEVRADGGEPHLIPDMEVAPRLPG